MTDPETQREADQLDGVPPPEASEHLIGHDDVVLRLRKQIEGGRLASGILLHGPRGIGKATLAFETIVELIAATGDEPAERVRAQVAAGSHPNVFVLRIPREDGRFKTEIRIGDVRHLIERLHQTRGRAGHRAVVIDAAEDCNKSAANALLKILEEPPAECHFFLISHQPGRLLPTIRSRCQSYAMRPLSETQLAEFAGSAGDATPTELGLASGNPRRLCELKALGDTGLIERVRQWLENPLDASDTLTLSISRDLADRQAVASEAFVRRLLLDWIADEARAAATSETGETKRLASASALWEKANRSFTETDIFNLDLSATYLTLFDAISAHMRLGAGILTAP
ncbi:MAG: AAA family ATPase [Hyphomicrobiaceae bacterium]|nr:AAA family ATPase [Hyphomicrobiaceae bacterium]MCC0023418.1 AAA family ATPase [Hyphomicrobiaceae bacterium]